MSYDLNQDEQKKVSDLEEFLKSWNEEDFAKEDFGKKKSNKSLILLLLTILNMVNCYLVFTFIFWSFNPSVWNWYGRLIAVIFLSVQTFASIKHYEKKDIL
jgi:hypothetical protein